MSGNYSVRASAFWKIRGPDYHRCSLTAKIRCQQPASACKLTPEEVAHAYLWKESKNGTGIDSKPGSGSSVQRYNPVTPGLFGEKRYCTHWIRTGECDFTQQGCMFIHCIPDFATLQELGFKSYPRWFREMPSDFQLSHAENLRASPHEMRSSRQDPLRHAKGMSRLRSIRATPLKASRSPISKTTIKKRKRKRQTSRTTRSEKADIRQPGSASAVPRGAKTTAAENPLLSNMEHSSSGGTPRAPLRISGQKGSHQSIPSHGTTHSYASGTSERLDARLETPKSVENRDHSGGKEPSRYSHAEGTLGHYLMETKHPKHFQSLGQTQQSLVSRTSPSVQEPAGRVRSPTRSSPTRHEPPARSSSRLPRCDYYRPRRDDYPFRSPQSRDRSPVRGLDGGQGISESQLVEEADSRDHVMTDLITFD